MKTEITEQFVVAQLNGKYWGTTVDDIDGWTTIEHAFKRNPKTFKQPTDFTFQGSPNFKELEQAKLVNVKVTTTKVYEINV